MMKTEEALAMIGGHVDEELLLRNEYLAAENEILRRKIQGESSSVIQNEFDWQRSAKKSESKPSEMSP